MENKTIYSSDNLDIKANKKIVTLVMEDWHTDDDGNESRITIIEEIPINEFKKLLKEL